jgi:hypothetical protein
MATRQRGSNGVTLEERLAAFAERMAKRPEPKREPCHHQWGTAYKSSSGRKVCVKCGFVTDKPFDSLGVAEGAD